MAKGQTAVRFRPEPDPVDIAVGLTICRLRRERRMSQSKLGAALRVTFQQIQKYERGANRVSASVLVRMAGALGVQPSDLLPTTDAPSLPDNAQLLTSVRGAHELLTSYAAIRSTARRRSVLRLVRALSEEPSTDDIED